MKFILEHAKDLLREPAAVKWIPLSALKSGEYMSCIDGRHKDCIIATPGGDTGIFIAIATAIEHQMGPLSEDWVRQAMGVIMEWHSRFYLHTDEFALAKLETSVLEKTGAKLPPGTNFEAFLKSPPLKFQPLIRKELVNPDHVGCGFLNQLLCDPDGYGVRRPLVEWVIIKFFDRIWSGSASPNFEVLYGEHQERAVLLIDTKSHDESPTSFVPALRGIEDGPSDLFINHRPARQFLAHENIRLLAHAGILPNIDIDAAIAFIDELCDAQLARVLNALAPHLATYEVSFDAAGENPEVVKRT